MRYGFVLDQNRCIGCHACTVACKEEHGVPVGVNRTWVKYVEKGTFPDTQRHFAVLRCNHCDDAPCITICPTGALFKRKNGIVDFDRDACIGCKACMQACPYDALYIDPQTQTAAKCNFCAHRVDKGLEPACVIVCPEQAIITGDLDNPNSRIARIVSREAVSVRKPEQGTKPKTFYLGADEAALTPTMSEVGQHQMWATPNAREMDFAKTLSFAAQSAPGVAKAVYDPPHQRAPWGWKVAAYLWTKSIAAGAMILGALPGLLKNTANPLQDRFQVTCASISIFFLALTSLLLIADLKRPSRFFLIVLRPNFRSWLVLGTWVLMAASLASFLWLIPAIRHSATGFMYLSLFFVILGPAVGCYSAFLFGQCEGRDFWQSPLLFLQLFFAALVGGGAMLNLVHLVATFDPQVHSFIRTSLLLGLLGHGAVVLAEGVVPHGSGEAALAARVLTRGAGGMRYWNVLIAGNVLPFLQVWDGSPLGAWAGAILALLGLAEWEWIWIKGGQSVPLS